LNRIDEKFKALKAQRRKALIFFVTCGDPSMKVTEAFLDYAQEAGVDCVELGVPFSDPLADGPVIQASSYRALKTGISLDGILKMMRRKRRAGLALPVVLMSALNPVQKMGYARAAERMRASGIDGIILPDCPVHESRPAVRELAARDLRPILMSTPTTDPVRERVIASRARGFLYYVSLVGLTGAVDRASFPFAADVRRLKAVSRAPVCVGFGIKTPAQAAAVARFSDGVIIGSSLVTHLKEHSKNGLSEASRRFVKSFVRAVKSVKS